MFNRDAVHIREESLKSSSTMARVLIFAITSANARFRFAVNACLWLQSRDIESLNYASFTMQDKSYMATAINPAKLSYVQSVWANREEIFEVYKASNALDFWNYLIDCVPGLGMVKAAFSVQMLYNELGCLDTNNVQALGLDPSAVTGKSQARRANYLTVQSVRTSKEWWDDWCNLMADRYPGEFDSGDYVSRLHSIAVLGV